MDDPRYGTVQPDQLPVLTPTSGVVGRLIAGSVDEEVGAFTSVMPLQIIDYVLQAGCAHVHQVSQGMDSTFVYVYKGSGTVGGTQVPCDCVIQLDASMGDAVRGVSLLAGEGEGFSAMLFAGRRLNQSIAWHGPFVMTTKAEIASTIACYQAGDFPPVRAPWDYKVFDSFPPAKAVAVVVAASDSINATITALPQSCASNK